MPHCIAASRGGLLPGQKTGKGYEEPLRCISAQGYVLCGSCAIPSESAQSEDVEPARLSNAEGAAGRSQEPPESSLLRRGSALTVSTSFEGLPVRDRLTLPQSLEDALGLDSSASHSMAGLLHGTTIVGAALASGKATCQHEEGCKCVLEGPCNRCSPPCPHLSTRCSRPALL